MRHAPAPFPPAAVFRLAWLLAGGALAACGGSSGGASDTDAAVVEGDAAGPEADAGVVCDEVNHRVNLPGPFACDAEPEFVTISASGVSYDVFKYEASHPLATADLAFTCAVSQGVTLEAPKVTTPACSKEGVRPWHSVRWDEAQAACEQTGEGWQLCTKEELIRACEGPEGNTYTYGRQFDGTACNVRNVYSPANSGTTSEAPTGAFEDCHSSEGVYDADGNLWEWASDRDPTDEKVRFYVGAGWMVNGARYMEGDQACATETKLPRSAYPTYATSFVGFRCCREH